MFAVWAFRMAETLHLFIVAGEASGDRIGADLVQRLRQKTAVRLSGVGGEELIGQGITTLFPLTDLEVMGLTDVLGRLPLLLWRIEQTARAIVALHPDVVVLVDAQDFSKRVARRAKNLGYRGPMVLYCAPTVWARAPERALKLKPLFEEVLAVLPFEPAIMAQLGGPKTSYVGHPAVSEVRPPTTTPKSGLVALLPGSREGELRRHLPLMRAMVAALSGQANIEGFYIPTLPSLEGRLRAEVSNWPTPVAIAAYRGDRPALYGRTLLAISVAGTATLELALAGVPMILTYVMDAPQASQYSRLGRPLVGLPNIVAGRQIVPEYVTMKPHSVVLANLALSLAKNQQARQNQIMAFGELVTLMQTGEPTAPRQDPADRVLSHWRGA